jgi:copper(I)-binding protein
MTNFRIDRRTAVLGLCATAAFVPAARAQHSHATPHAHGGTELRIEQPWSRATAGNAKTGAGYLKIHNPGTAADRLVAAESPVSARMELHEMAMVDNVMRMRPLERGIPVPAAGEVELKPGGLHLMFIDLKAPLVQGTKIPVTLRFEKKGEVKIELDVRDLRAGPPAGHGH